LKVPKDHVRPTPDLVKQAVSLRSARSLSARGFGIVSRQRRVELMLSRGAASVMCVEKSYRHANLFAATQGSVTGIGSDFFPVMNQLAEIGRHFI